MAIARLTIALITKNEAEHIEACLQSVAWADEIVIVDLGSRDGTQALAEKYTKKIFNEMDWKGFGRQRQRAQSMATGDWILVLVSCRSFKPSMVASFIACKAWWKRFCLARKREY